MWQRLAAANGFITKTIRGCKPLLQLFYEKFGSGHKARSNAIPLLVEHLVQMMASALQV
jgi:hypothetical protein